MTQSYKLAVFEQGQGKPLVLLHGLISTHRYWNQVVELLDDNSWQKISIDLLGFGDSPKPKDGLYNLEQQVACVDKAITSEVEPPYTLVGHSMGAMISLKWATEKPELFSRLVFTSMPLFRPEIVWQQIASLSGKDKIFKRKTIAKVAVKSFGWASLMPIKVMTFQSKWPEHIVVDSRKHTRHSYWKTLDNIVFADELLGLLRDIKVPVHLIIGQDDAMVGEEGIKSLEKIAKDNSNLSIQVIDAGHDIPLQHPEVVAKAILSV